MMAYLPVLPAVRDRANAYLAGMAARGFVPPPMADVVRHFERVTPRPAQEEPITPPDREDAATRLQIKFRKLLNPESRDSNGRRLAPDLGLRGEEMFKRMSEGPGA